MGMKLPRFLRIAPGPTRHTFAAATLNASPVNTRLQLPKTDSGWQGQAWSYYEVVPEMRQVVEHRANAVSKVVLRVAQLGPDGKPEVVDTPDTRSFLDWLFGGREQHGAHLALLAQQGTVVGESILVIVRPQADVSGKRGPEEWYTLAPDQVDTSKMNGPSGYVCIKDPTNGQERRYPTTDNNQDSTSSAVRIIRLWKSHPRNQWEADSPTRGAIATLDTIAHLNASIKSAALSRLIGGGIYPIPAEAQLPQPTKDDKPGITAYDKFRNDLYDAATTAIQNPASAAAQLPIFMHIPAEAIKAMPDKPIDFSTKFDERVGELLDKEIRRYAQGQPMPTEKVVGQGGGNHWSDWQMSEEDLKMDIAPLTSLFLSALTAQILQPLLGEAFFLHPDFTDLVTRPDRTPEAIQLFDAELITREEGRLLSGFPEKFNGELKPRPTAIQQVPGSRPEIPQRAPIRDGQTYSAEPEPFMGLVTNNLFVVELLRETGRRMLSSAPRPQRAEMMQIPEEERHHHFSGAFAAFQTVLPKIVARYDGVLPADQISAGVLAAQSAISERVMSVQDG
jgi:hypothetical protein